MSRAHTTEGGTVVHDASQEAQGRSATELGGPVIGLTGRLGASWGTVLAVGLITLVIGILIVAWPEATVGVLAVLFGLQLLLLGVLNIARAISAQGAGGGERVLYALLGVLCIAIGVLAMRHLLQTVAVLAVLFGLTWLIGGIIEFVNTLSSPSQPGRGWSIAMAVLMIIAGLVVLAYPTPSLVTLTVLVGIWLMVWGALTAILAFVARPTANR
jgi:uncharacterized membrane protein HdeD (DUF308 family)